MPKSEKHLETALFSHKTTYFRPKRAFFSPKLLHNSKKRSTFAGEKSEKVTKTPRFYVEKVTKIACFYTEKVTYDRKKA